MKQWSIAGLVVTGCALGAGWVLMDAETAEGPLSPAGDSPALSALPSPESPIALRAQGEAGSAAAPVRLDGTLPPPSRPVTAPEQRAAALRIVNALGRGPTEAGCAASEDALLELAARTAVDSSLWTWTMNRARDCLRAPTPFRKNSPLLAKLQELFPDHPRVQELAGLQSYDSGRPADAAAELEEALGDQGSFESWQTLADAKLTMAREAADPSDRAAALAAAEDAMNRALKLATPALRPYALHTMARVQIELGRADQAVEWANRALEAVGDGSGVYQAYMAAEMHLFAGQIYYRAGQHDAGLAYMDQGVSMAGTEKQRGELQQLRDRFLQIYRAS